MTKRSSVVPGVPGAWPGIEPRAYKAADGRHRYVARYLLFGGEEIPAAFELRYFEIAPGGHSTLEQHRHAHAVVVVHGRGTVRLGDEVTAIEPFALVTVAPEQTHQFRAAADAPLGFLCIVDRERDRPRPVAR